MPGHQQQSQEAPKSPGRRVSRWLGLLFLTLLSAALTFTIGEYVLLPRIPLLMIGAWTVAEGKYEGGKVEFRRDGTMLSTLRSGSPSGQTRGTITVDGFSLSVSTIDPVSGRETMDRLTIVELSRTCFVTQDDDGNILVMRR